MDSLFTYALLGVIGIVGVSIVSAVIGSCFTIVDESTEELVERLGKFNRALKPGFHLKWPIIERVAAEVSMRLQQQQIQVETKTKDDVAVTVFIQLQFKVLDAKRSWYSVEDEEEQFDSFVKDAVRSKVARLTLDQLFESTDGISNDVKMTLQDSIWELGFKIHSALVSDIQPDGKVVAAMNEIQAQTRMRAAAIEKAEADKALAVKRAEAESESKRLQGEGIAKQRRAIVDGLKASIADMSSSTGINGREVLQTILLTQYFDTMKEVGAHGSRVIYMPSTPGGLSSISGEIAKAISMGNEAGTSPHAHANGEAQVANGHIQ